MLHVDINKVHNNIIMLRVDVMYHIFREQKYANIDLNKLSIVELHQPLNSLVHHSSIFSQSV